MVFFIIILMLIMFMRVNVTSEGNFVKDYMSKEKTTAIKGIFVILIIFSHYSQYVELGGIYDDSYLALKNHLNQMVVSMFWFYSGYGIMESISKKGIEYVKTIPTKRFLTVLINFDIAVLLYLVLNLCLGNSYDVKTILLSLIGWKSVGNSNWYIFATLVMYICTYFSFVFYKNDDEKIYHYVGTIVLSVLCIVFVYFQMLLKRPGYTYNTIILYVLGFWYSLFKKKIDELVMKNQISYLLSFLIILVLYCYFIKIRFSGGIEAYTIYAVSFTLLIVLTTMKITFYNPILEWFGNHVFSVYILQRIPMIVLDACGLSGNKYTFLILSIISTMLFAIIFDYYTNKLNKRLFNIIGKRTR